MLRNFAVNLNAANGKKQRTVTLGGQHTRTYCCGLTIGDMLQHAVQTANNTAVYHLIQAGYDAQYLTAMLIKKVREERVTEPNTVACQLVLAKAKGHGGRFHVTNGAHMT